MFSSGPKRLGWKSTIIRRSLVSSRRRSDEAARIPTLYGTKLLALEPLALLLVPRLRRYGYEHECGAESWPRTSLVERPLLTQIAVNHLDAYLQKLGIRDDQLNTLAVFALIRV